MKCSLIVAANLDGVIGGQNQLLWHLPKDLKRFKSLTMGKPILMGRKTFESIGKPLPGRTSIIITRNPNYSQPGALVVSSVEAALRAAEGLGAEEAFIIGGGEIYKQALPFTDRIHLTIVHNRISGDTYFEIPDSEQWVTVSREFHSSDEKHAFDFEFLELERRP